MHPKPYLFFDGTCRAALEHYADIFGAKIEMLMTYAELPPSEDLEVPPEKADWIMHGSLAWPDGGQLMASDTLEGDSSRMDGTSIMMELSSVDAGRSAYDRLAQGGEVGMPYGPTFWAPAFGTVKDRFGTRWMITTGEAA